MLILSGWFSFELLLDNSIVCSLLSCAHPVKITSSGLILANRLLNVKRINLLNELEVHVRGRGIHTKVQVFLDLFKSHRWCALSLLDLLRDAMILLSIETLVLDHVVEAGLVSLDSQILLDVIFFLFELVFIKATESFLRLGSLLLGQSLNLSQMRLFIRDNIANWFKVLAFCRWSSQYFSFLTNLV